MGEEENNFNIHEILNEMNSKKNNQFQPNNIFINNYDNNLIRNKSDNMFQNKRHKINNYNIPKEHDLNNLNNKFKGNIFKINYNPINLGYNRDINQDYHFSENNYFQPNIINCKMINDISSNRFEYGNKYHNLNKNRIFASEKKPKGIMDKYKNKILLKNEKERIIHKKEDDIKDLDNEENIFYLRTISGKEKLLKNLNNEIEKIERLINAKKLEKTRRRLVLEKIKLEDIKEEERERIEWERRKKEEERLIKEYFIREEERKRKELEQKRIEEERKRLEEERERKRIIEENRRKTKLAEIKKKLERIIQRMEENEENKFNSFNRLNMNYHHMSNINDILNKSINMNSNIDGSIINNINSSMNGSIINNMNNNMNGSIINNINISNMNNNMENNNMNSNNMNNNNINSNNINNNMDNNNININNRNTNMNNNNMNSNNINTNNNSIINNNLIDESFINNETLSLNFSNDLNEREIESHEEVDLNRFFMRNNNNINNLVGPIKKILNALPENRIADVNKLNEENRKCLICLEEYVNNDNIIYLPCFHIFHKKCIIPWIKTHVNCPLCKININEIIK